MEAVMRYTLAVVNYTYIYINRSRKIQRINK